MQGKDDLHVPLASAVVKETVVTYLLEVFRKNMLQEPADELLGGQGARLFIFAVFSVCIVEGRAVFREGKDPAVGDGNLVCVFGQIFDVVPFTVAGLLYPELFTRVGYA